MAPSDNDLGNLTIPFTIHSADLQDHVVCQHSGDGSSGQLWGGPLLWLCARWRALHACRSASAEQGDSPGVEWILLPAPGEGTVRALHWPWAHSQRCFKRWATGLPGKLITVEILKILSHILQFCIFSLPDSGIPKLEIASEYICLQAYSNQSDLQRISLSLFLKASPFWRGKTLVFFWAVSRDSSFLQIKKVIYPRSLSLPE